MTETRYLSDKTDRWAHELTRHAIAQGFDVQMEPLEAGGERLIYSNGADGAWMMITLRVAFPGSRDRRSVAVAASRVSRAKDLPLNRAYNWLQGYSNTHRA